MKWINIIQYVFVPSGEGWSFSGNSPLVLKGLGLTLDNAPGVINTFFLNFNPQTVTVLQIGYRVTNMIEVSITSYFLYTEKTKLNYTFSTNVPITLFSYGHGFTSHLVFFLLNALVY